jgi:catechol 2,3-dioxygenase-like lactoylglutathione lyase family enzyme
LQEAAMINGTHILFYSTDADADRAFLRDVLGLRGIDVGGGWMIFKTPPAEAAVHPYETGTKIRQADANLLAATVHFMCDDVGATVRELEQKKVKCAPLHEESWGIATMITLPSGGAVGLYQPKHATAYNLK